MLHPEMAEPIVWQVIVNYVNAGKRLGLKPNWEKFQQSTFFQECSKKYPQAPIEKQLEKAKDFVFPEPTMDGLPTTTIGYVIRDYVNAGMAVGLPPNWDSFRASDFYATCVEKFSKDEAEKEIASAKSFTDPLNKPLPPGFLGKK